MNSSIVESTQFGVSAKRKRRILLLIPVAISLVVAYFWPAKPCEKVVVEFGQMQQALVTTNLLAKLDSLAYGGHCDTFSLIRDKNFWIVPKCGKSGSQFRDSLQLPGVSATIQAIVKQAKVGAVHYHYPNMSFELNHKFRGGLDFRLVYSRNPLVEGGAFWSSCEEAAKQHKERYNIFLTPHWYIAAKKIEFISRN